ncbi:uncharacterized protein LOC131596206 [Vicia villosa]|uniref:uncharacterized protein LOC131596206 n=1 Tax=Vicia villosa TaxID=3911 RepID=UPI00273BDE1C|nr:uncharacterized protein LOC131596206 [Vicia villosa]
MATKPKESSTLVGKEKKKVPSSTSIPTPTKRIAKPSTAIKSNSTTPSEKNSPSSLKPTTNFRQTKTEPANSPSSLKPTTNFRQTKTEPPIKPPAIRRRSFDKPLSSSNLTTQPPPSRLHKALVSPGPRERSTSLNTRSPNVPVKSVNPLKPISEKTPSDAKTKLVWKKAAKKITAPNSNIPNSNATKKVSKDDHAASVSPAKTKSVATDKDSSTVETEDVKEVKEVANEEVKEVANQEVEVIKVENEEPASHENVSSDVNSEIVHEHEHEHDNQVLEDSGTPQNQVDDEKVISTVSEEAEKESQEEKHEVEHEEKHEVEHEEKENNDGNQPEEVNHSEVEREEGVNENEQNESVIVKEDEKSETSEEQGREEKETVEGGVSEEVKEVEVEAKAEVAKPKQQVAGGGNGKKESQVSNDMIEETASKLLGRKNKVLALAGAFQTVIDHQAK